MIEFISDLEAAMRDHGYHIIGNINMNATKPQRFRSALKPRGTQDLFVILHGDKGATFGDWHNKDGWVLWWKEKGHRQTIAEKIAYENKMQELMRQKEEKKLIAIKRAYHLWNKDYCSILSEGHPYVIKKRIRAYYSREIRHFRFIKNTLLIPIRNIDYQFVGLQIIKANGFKRFWKGASPNHNMVWLSERLSDDYSGIIRVCEGYATGCSIYEAAGSPVVCALSASNIINVVAQLRKKYPKSMIRICADDDRWGKENVGMKVAINASKLHAATLTWPDFSKYDVSGKPTDFNDLMCLAGIEEVENQLILIRKQSTFI